MKVINISHGRVSQAASIPKFNATRHPIARNSNINNVLNYTKRNLSTPSLPGDLIKFSIKPNNDSRSVTTQPLAREASAVMRALLVPSEAS